MKQNVMPVVTETQDVEEEGRDVREALMNHLIIYTD